MTSPIRAATVRPTTLDPSLWARAVRSLAALGFNAIDVPLVWRDHERPDGRLDFETAERDVGRFLGCVAAEGLRAVVHLGPWPISDVTHLGLPDRVLRDRACQARTRRQNPVLVLDLPRLVPLPSVASARYRSEAAAWVAAAVTALGPRLADGTVARLIVGHGPPAVLRDDPFEADHHPDARGDAAPVSPPHHPPLEAGVAEVERQSLHARDFLLRLRDAALGAGASADVLTLAVPGSALASPLALSLAAEHRLAFTAPPPRAGVTGIWREVRFAMSLAGGAHLHLRAGGPPFEPPMRATHSLQAARVALAAGARDVTVQAGCVGHGWIGALLDERADPRAHAARWAALLEESAAWPSGEERGVPIPHRHSDVVAARAATGVHPLPVGLLAWVGMGLDELSAAREGATDAGRSLEESLAAKAVPHWRSVDAPERDASGEAWAGDAPTVSPPGAALVRSVSSERGRALLVCSRAEGPIEVSPPPGRWRDERGPATGARALAGGEVAVWREVTS
ncbi:MAG: beta-galactosidase [Polyangiales bacterium]